jgi:hypothetical protein
LDDTGRRPGDDLLLTCFEPMISFNVIDIMWINNQASVLWLPDLGRTIKYPFLAHFLIAVVMEEHRKTRMKRSNIN